jgi:fibronectin-binding autotransporter adhesin
MNTATLYAVSASYTFANSLTLNGATLRVGGGASHILTWTGQISVTADSSIIADGGTAGVTLSGGLNMNSSGNTLTSYANGTATTISAPITGASGTIMVTYGTLNLNAANTFGGSFRSSAGGLLKLGNANAMQSATLDMNAADAGSVNLNNLSATLGALTGSRNLALGSGAVSIGNNNLSTTYDGVLSGTGSLTKIGNGTLTLSNTNNYSGATAINGGTLAFGTSNVLPASAMIIGNAILDAATFTDTVGTLKVSGGAKINLGAGAALVFSNSSAVNWTGGSLSLTGTFVSGSSLRFGTTSAALTPTQLGLITATGFSSFALNASGFLTANAVGINTAPTISDIANQSVPSGGTTGALSFTVGDAETAASSLIVAGSSSNTSLVPHANIVFGGSGTNRTVTVTPVSGLSGTATITVTVADVGSLTATDTFVITITDNYLSWATANGVTGDVNGDSDNDGVQNLVEYALVNGGERGAVSGNTITFTKRGAPYANDVSYTIETSESLADGSWTDAVTQAPGDPAPTISYTFTPGTPAKSFVRLKVTQQ